MKATNTPGPATRPQPTPPHFPGTGTVALVATAVLVALLSVVALGIVVSTM
ncbi:hypothetical protein F5X71_20875 [Nocardia brasiliensis]|uniref:Uncharacterized protein n=1 Tax=Nocardia brasiliensis TaxID=37326 RepID=A0A6G9XU50_NOCBR|nr:hypothetical protein [Nocardia brasiliensis]QIS04454.1 hypothetical protein F5X71_20875 [Nocardia brasiliensis]